jgi:hypothetical protein
VLSSCCARNKLVVASPPAHNLFVHCLYTLQIICDILRLYFVVDATTTTTNQKSKDAVASQGVLTLMSMAAVSTDYARDIWMSNGTDVILALLAKQTQHQRQSMVTGNTVLQERCAAALEVLTGTLLDVIPQDLDFAQGEMMDRLVDRLASQLNVQNDSSYSPCPGHAICALYNLLCCKWPSNLKLSDKVNRALRCNTELLWKMLESQDLSVVVKESILGIIGGLYETSVDDRLLSSKRFSLLLTFLGKDRPLPLHMATLGLLMTSPNIVAGDGSAAIIVARISKTLKRYETNESIHLVGLIVIQSLLQQTNDVLQPTIVNKLRGSTTRIMTWFPNDLSIQQAACLLLATLCHDANYGKHFALSQSGVDAAVHAFEGIFSCNAPPEAKYAVTSILASLPQRSLSTTDADPCLLLLVEKAMREEPEPDLRGHLLGIVRTLLKDVFPIQHESVSVSAPTSNVVDSILEMIDQQQQHTPRDVLQCYVLLGTIYSIIPFTPGDHDGSITLVQLGQGSCFRLKTHSTNEFVTLWNALAMDTNMHEDPNIVTACCCALSNYLGPLCALLGTVTDDATLEQALGNRELSISSEMLRILHGTMQRHKTNVDVTVHAMELFRILVTLTKADVLNEWGVEMLSLMVESMKEWESNDKIESNGLNIIATLLQKTRDFALLSHRDFFFGVIVRGLESDSEVAVLQAAWFLAGLLANEPSSAEISFYATNTSNSIIRCMVKHASTAEVQRQCCIVLQQGIGSQQQAHKIANAQGLQAITNALERHSGLAELVEPACWVLHKMLVDIDTNVLWEHRRLVGAAVASCMKNNVANHATATKAIVNIWLHLCSKKDFFKAEIIDSTPLLLQAMRANLDNESLQLSSCSIIKLLCRFGEGRKLAGPMGAVHSVLDALLAHRGSARLVKEGFLALKMLIWEEVASIMLEPLEIYETVVCIARIHLDDPIIQKEAMTMATLDNTAVLKDVVLEWIISVMKQHQADESVQQCACLCLKSHMFHPSSCGKMKKQNNRLQVLLYNSVELFWASCGTVAIEISERIMR